MPELPEVETTRRGIEPHVLGRRIEQVVIRESRLRWAIPATLAAEVVGRRIDSTSRRGKYLLLHLDNQDRLIVHLGMSGGLRIVPVSEPPRKHDHVDFYLGARLLRFHDPRRFGAILPWRAGTAEHPLLAKLGPEPLSDEFDGDYLYQRSRGKRVAVKPFLMDSQVVVGTGNIYAAESLFRAGLRPSRPAGGISRAGYRRLALSLREVLGEALEQGGTTLRDFLSADGAPGYFQQVLSVYGRAGQPCRVCATPIASSRLGQRSSFWCPRCQR